MVFYAGFKNGFSDMAVSRISAEGKGTEPDDNTTTSGRFMVSQGIQNGHAKIDGGEL